MHTVTFETAKRLAEAGFPQPTPERGQIWLSEVGAEYLIQAVGQDGSVDYSFGNAYPFLCRHLDADGCIFAPTTTDIMRELPEYAVARHIDYRGQSGEAWFCWDTLDRHETFSHPTNPAEAAAMAWLHENKKP